MTWPTQDSSRFPVEGRVAPGQPVGETDPVIIGGCDEGNDVRMIRTDNIGRVVIIGNVEPAVVSSLRGPSTITLTNSSNNTAVAAPGVGKSIYVITIHWGMEEDEQTVWRAREGGAGTALQFATKVGGSFSPMPFNPPWVLPENTSLVYQRTTGSKDIIINTHWYVGDSP